MKLLSPQSAPLLIPAYRHIQDSKQIIRLQGNGNYTVLHLRASPKPLLITLTLKAFEGQLPGFIRVHKSSLINPAYVKKVIYEADKTISLLLTDGVRIAVSRRRTEEALARFV